MLLLLGMCNKLAVGRKEDRLPRSKLYNCVDKDHLYILKQKDLSPSLGGIKLSQLAVLQCIDLNQPQSFRRKHQENNCWLVHRLI